MPLASDPDVVALVRCVEKEVSASPFRSGNGSLAEADVGAMVGVFSMA